VRQAAVGAIAEKDTDVTLAITGAKGFVGRALVARLRSDGVDVRPTDLDTLDVRHAVPAEAFAGCEVVVHLAALTGVAPSMRRPDDYRRTNVDGTAHVVEAAVAAGVQRLVFASSSSVYGECPTAAAEDRDLAPLSPYGQSKVEAEAVVQAASGFERVVVRPFTVYGPGQRADMLIARLLAGDDVRLFPFVRDFTFIDEVVDGLVAAASGVGTGSIVNLGSGRPVAASELLSALAEVTGRTIDVEWIDGRAGEPRQTWADPTRGRDLLGLGQPIELVEGLRRQVACG